MSSFRPVLSFVVFGLLLPGSLSAAVPSMDTLLPKTTVGFVSATNSIRLTEQWNKTQLGKLMAEPVMKPFEEDLRAQMQAQWSALADRLGYPSGRFARSVHAVSLAWRCWNRNRARRPPACSWMLPAISTSAKALLAKARAGLAAGGGQETIQTIRGIPVYVFAVPLPAGPAGGGGAGRCGGRGRDGADGLFPHRELLRRLRRPGRRAGYSRPAGQRQPSRQPFPGRRLSNGHEALRGRRPRARARHPLVHLSVGLRRGDPGGHAAGKAATRARRSSKSCATRATRPSRAWAVTSTFPPTATRSSIAPRCSPRRLTRNR